MVTVPSTAQELGQLYLRIAEAKIVAARALRALELVAATDPDAAKPDFSQDRVDEIMAQVGCSREQLELLEWAGVSKGLLDTLDAKFILAPRDSTRTSSVSAPSDTWHLPASLFFFHT